MERNLMFNALRLLLLISLVTSLLFYLVTTSRAQSQPTVAIDPPTQNGTVGSQVSLDVTVSNVTNLGSYQFSTSFDPSIVQVVSVTNGAFLGSTSRSVSPLPADIDNTNGDITVGAFTLGATPAGPNGTGILATIVFDVSESGTTNINLSAVTLTNVAGDPIPANTENGQVNAFSEEISPTPSLTPTPTPTPSPSPTGNPVALSYLLTSPLILGQNFTVDIILTNNQPLSGVDVIGTFDPTAVQLTSIDDNHLLPVTPLLDINNTTGTFRISQVINPGTPFTASGSLATLTYTSLSATTTPLSFSFTPGLKSDTNVISFSTGNDLLASASSLNLDIVNPADLQLSLTTPSEDTTTGHTVTGTLTDQNSTFSAQLSTDTTGATSLLRLPPEFIGTLKTFFFKVTGFLREKIEVTIQPGLNLINLGLIKAGDLNDDGIINTIDLSLMYDSWFESGPADFNKDGIANSADHWVLIQNYLSEDE